MAETKAWFGLGDEPLSLKNRLFAELTRRLAFMDMERDANDDSLYCFTSDKARVFVRITQKHDSEEYYYSVEILDDAKTVLFSENVYWAGFPSTLNYHPFCELLELIGHPTSEHLAKAKIVANLIERL